MRAGRAGRREQARVEPALGGDARPGAVAAERLRDGGDDADLAAAVAVAPAPRDLSAVVLLGGSSGSSASIKATISAAGTTSSRRQPFVAPTSMYSMNRRMWPLPRKCRASSTIWSSLTPRLTTALTFTFRPAAAAAAIPSSTRLTGKPTSFIARNVASSSESRLTVTRRSPAAASASAFWGKQGAVRRQRDVELAEPARAGR